MPTRILGTGGPTRSAMSKYSLDGIDVIERWIVHCPDYDRLATNATW